MASTLLEHTRSATPSAPALTSLAGRPAACVAHTQLHQPSVKPAGRPGAHEECERLERLIVRDFRKDAKGHAERLAQGHRVRKMLDQIQAQAEKLVRPLHPLATPASGTCANALKQPCTCRGAYTRTRTVCARRRLPPCAARTCTGAGARREGSMSKTRTGAIRPVPACWAVRWLPADVKCGVYCSSPVICTSRSAFYERLKDVRDYHRRYPYLEVSEVRSGAAGSPVPLSPRLAGYALALAALALRTPWGTWHWGTPWSTACFSFVRWRWALGPGHASKRSDIPMRWRWALGTGQSLVRSLVCLPMLALGTQCWALPGARPVHS